MADDYDVDRQQVQDAPVEVERKTVLHWDAEADPPGWQVRHRTVTEQVVRSTERHVGIARYPSYHRAVAAAKAEFGPGVYVNGDDAERAQQEEYLRAHAAGLHQLYEPGCPDCEARAAGVAASAARAAAERAAQQVDPPAEPEG